MTAHNVSLRNHAWFSDDKLCAVIDRGYSDTGRRDRLISRTPIATFLSNALAESLLYRYKTHRMRYLKSVDPTDEEIALLGGITDRKLGALRLILSAAALLIIYIDPTEPDRYVSATYSSIVAYTFFSLLVYLAARKRTNFPSHILKLLIWFDIACFTALISMSSGTSSVFYFFYMFEIIVACSRGGRRLGLAVTAASSLLCVVVGLLVQTSEVFELNRFLLRPLAISLSATRWRIGGR